MGKRSFEARQAKRGYILAMHLANEMGLHHSTIYRWIQKKKITAEHIGNRRWVRIASLRTYLGDHAFKLYKLDELIRRLKR